MLLDKWRRGLSKNKWSWINIQRKKTNITRQMSQWKAADVLVASHMGFLVQPRWYCLWYWSNWKEKRTLRDEIHTNSGLRGPWGCPFEKENLCFEGKWHHNKYYFLIQPMFVTGKKIVGFCGARVSQRWYLHRTSTFWCRVLEWCSSRARAICPQTPSSRDFLSQNQIPSSKSWNRQLKVY